MTATDDAAHSRAAEGATELPIAYVRLYTDEDGNSRLEDVRLVGETRGVTESDLRAMFSEPIAVGEIMFRHVISEAEDDGPHNTPHRQFIVQLSGECEIEVTGGMKRRLGPGSVLLLEDVDGAGHVTRRVGASHRLTLAIPLGDGALLPDGTVTGKPF